jgi:hypothetical protein
VDDLRFKLDVSIDDRTGRPRAAYLQVREGAVAETREVSPGRAFADYDGQGRLLGIEFLAPCGVELLDTLTADEPEPVREFFRTSPPRTLVCA